MVKYIYFLFQRIKQCARLTVFSSLKYSFYPTWALNISYGGGVTAIAENEIDLFLGIIAYSTDREPYYTPIAPILIFE